MNEARKQVDVIFGVENVFSMKIIKFFSKQ
jgi:hypothetical protein